MLQLQDIIVSQSLFEKADGGLWILFGIIAIAIFFFVRRLNKAGLKRLQRGPETVQQRENKRKEAQKKHGGIPDELRGDDEPPRPREKVKKEKPAKQPAAPEPVVVEEKPEDKLLLPAKSMNEGLAKTRNEGFVGRLGKLFRGSQIDENLLDQIEEVLFTADIGVKTSDKLLTTLKAALSRKELESEDRIWAHLREQAQLIFAGVEHKNSLQLTDSDEPYVVLVVGVNGAGKTTTIGKLANLLGQQGKKIVVGAGDTFRAAAAEQLAIWANRVGAEIVAGEDGQDPSSVLFEAVKHGSESKADVVICDTAGRLHTQKNLVEELKKIHRVLGKAQEGAPHEVLLVLDATNGQNAIQQALTFQAALGVTGIVLTKLDGTAKGGVILGICDELKLPISWVGVGERTEDLRRFDPEEFVDALFPKSSL